MATQSVTSEQIAPREHAVPARVSSRIGFRFVVVYFGLYCVFTQIVISLLPVQNVQWLPQDLSRVPPFRWLTLWTAAHVFRVAKPPNYADTGSGDTLFDWVTLFCLIVLAVRCWPVFCSSSREPQCSAR
jgi:hypothetical protein